MHTSSLDVIDADGAIRETAAAAARRHARALPRQGRPARRRADRRRGAARPRASPARAVQEGRRRDPQLRADARVPRGGVLHRGRGDGRARAASSRCSPRSSARTSARTSRRSRPRSAARRSRSRGSTSAARPRTPAAFAATAQVLEDTGVAAYAGQAPRVKSNAILKAALAIHTSRRATRAGSATSTASRRRPAAFDEPLIERAGARRRGGDAVHRAAAPAPPRRQTSGDAPRASPGERRRAPRRSGVRRGARARLLAGRRPRRRPQARTSRSADPPTHTVALGDASSGAVAARAAPDSPAPASSRGVRTRTPERTPEALPLLARREVDGRLWVRVRLPVLPNGTTGWVPRGRLGGYETVRTHLIVDRRRLTRAARAPRAHRVPRARRHRRAALADAARARSSSATGSPASTTPSTARSPSAPPRARRR